MKRIVLLGGGGHCKVILQELLRDSEYHVEGIVDLSSVQGRKILDVPICFEDSQLPTLLKNGIQYAFVSVGSLGDSLSRRRLHSMAVEQGFQLPAIVSARAIVADDVKMGKGVFIGPGAIINSGSVIGDGAIINSGCIVEHDCRVGAFSHISPGVVLCGEVQVGDKTHVGAGSVVIQGIKILENSLIGAGSVVNRDISACKVAYGNPCKEVRDHAN